MRKFNHRPYVFNAIFGWSLLELLSVLAIMAISISFAVPSLYAAWQLQSLQDERQRLSQKIRYARLTSLQKGSRVSVCWAPECGAEQGFIIYLDANTDGYWQSKEKQLSHFYFNKDIAFSFNRGVQISFNSAGNTAHSGTMLLCPKMKQLSGQLASKELGYALVVSSSGRLREEKALCP